MAALAWERGESGKSMEKAAELKPFVVAMGNNMSAQVYETEGCFERSRSTARERASRSY
jgi:hypothetical protein